MNIEEKIKQLSLKSIYGVKKATKLGDSYGLILPMPWIKWKCTQIDGEYYFILKMHGDSVICHPITEADLGEE
jgi:hypothetical protein